MRFLVCGGRAFADVALVARVLDALPIDEIGHGGASGADALAGEWAIRHNVTLAVYPAQWAVHGKAAGPIRNQKMLNDFAPDMVIAFPGGRGTADMVARARRACVPTYVVPIEETD